MKGIERLTSVRLAEILTERAVVSNEVITDALYAQDKHGEPFAQVLMSGGHITEWDLAKIVTENFNLPFLMAGNYQISDEAKKRLPKELLWKHTIVPLDVFGDVVCISMPVMLSFDEINRIQKEHNCDLYPYVGLPSENKKVLTEMDKTYPQWVEQEQKRREEDAKKRQSNPGKSAGDWMSIFDEGEKAVLGEKKKPTPPAPPAAPATPPTPPPAKAAGPASGMSLFDEGDKAIQDEKKKPPAAPKPPTPPAPPKK